MWANLSSYISQLPAWANPPFSNGAVITPQHNLTHRLSQPQNRGYRLGGGSRGKSGTESLFSKSRCWTLRAPFCVWPFLHSPHCLPLLHVERHSAGRNGKFYFSTKNFKSLKKSTFERKLSTAQFSPPVSLEKMSHGLKWEWNYADYMHSKWKAKFKGNFSKLYHSQRLNFFSYLALVFWWHRSNKGMWWINDPYKSAKISDLPQEYTLYSRHTYWCNMMF